MPLRILGCACRLAGNGTYPFIRRGKESEMQYGSCKKEIKPLCGRLLVSLCLAIFLAIGAAGALAAPKQIPSAKPGDCAACHGSQKVLPAEHKDTKGMAYQNCLECHEKTGPASLRGKLPSGHVHRLAGMGCQKCHGKTKKPQEVEMKQCVTCHNMDAVTERTAKVKPQNPHESPHYGKSLDCNLCHHAHTKSENYCNQCHKFDFVVP